MIDLVNLKKTGFVWEFENESALEDFVWANLQELLGFTPLKRQYCVNGQYCDILALDENKQLVVLELKNASDRYIVQQLTRYYEALREEKPFNEQIDYEQPIKLIAITPSFHRDNFTDRKYSHLTINFIKFEILSDEDSIAFQLTDLDSDRKVSACQINYKEQDINPDVPAPPRMLLNRLAKSSSDNQQQRESVLKIRRKILTFDNRMQESIVNNRIEYGKGKTKPCAIISFSGNKISYEDRPNLFLRLPEVDPYYKQAIIWMHIGTDKDWNSFDGMVICIRTNKGFCVNTNRVSWQYNFPQFIEIIERAEATTPMDTQSHTCYQNYEKLIKSGSNSLDILVDIALEHWRKKL